MEMLVDGDFGPLTEYAAQGARRRGGARRRTCSRSSRTCSRWRGIEETRDRARPRAARSGGVARHEVVHDWAIRLQQERATPSCRCGRTTRRSSRPIKALLKRVFGNLIQNALTHSAQRRDAARSARARTAAACSSPSPTTAPGIPPEYHELIFRKFEQVKTPNIPRVRSSGLGLAFCKLVVEAHGGRIWVQSDRRGRAARSTSRCPCIRRARRRAAPSGAVSRA